MANQEHLSILKQGVTIWNQWRKEHPDIQPDLVEAQLQGVTLIDIQLEKANLSQVQLQGAILHRAQLQGANLFMARLEKADLSWAQLEKATLHEANLQGVNLYGANLKNTGLIGAQLQNATLYGAQLQGASLPEAQLQNATLSGAQLQGTILSGAQLDRIDLRMAVLSNSQHIGPRLADVQWGDTNLAVIDWSQVRMLGDEYEAQRKTLEGKKKAKHERLDEYRKAVRANRQLAVAMRDQGLNEEADYFAYRAQMLQRVVWWRQQRLLKYILSWFLYLIAGYGYRPLRSLFLYFLVIGSFAIGYYEVTHVLHAQPYPLAWYEALILSISSFHGRGFFQPVQSLGDPVAILASIEAVFGLLIEISFIATFTQRFFGK